MAPSTAQSHRKQKLNFYYGAALGQLLAFGDAVSGTLVELQGKRSKPLVIAALTYALMVLVYGTLLVARKGLKLSLEMWKYAAIGTLDVGASYFVLESLKYTTITSWTLIGPCSLLAAVPLSVVLLGASYNRRHLLSGITAVSGLILLLLSDYNGTKEEEDGSRSALDQLKGDIMALAGALIYGFNNVAVEFLVKDNVPKYEVLSMTGIFSLLGSSLFGFALGNWSSDLFEDRKISIYIAITALVNFGVYSVGIVVLQLAGAATMDISWLTSNLWAILSNLFIIGDFHTNVVGFIASLILIVSGIGGFVYSGDPYEKRNNGYVVLNESEIQGVTIGTNSSDTERNDQSLTLSVEQDASM